MWGADSLALVQWTPLLSLDCLMPVLQGLAVACVLANWTAARSGAAYWPLSGSVGAALPTYAANGCAQTARLQVHKGPAAF